MDYSYSTIDRIWRISIGEMADFTGAKYDGDFSMTLEEAQKNKHQWIAENLNLKPGDRAIDMGCGWGPFLNYLKSIGVHGVGVTLSQGQYAACKKNGFDVHIKNIMEITPDDFGMFDGISSIGSFEAYCSIDDYKNGRQDEVYQHFFKVCADLLPKGGRLFVQTMVFEDGMIPIEKMDINAPKDSNEYLMALIENEFPNSWLPYGLEHIERCADPLFKMVTHHNSKFDYIETIDVWRKMLKSFGFKKYLAYLELLPAFLTDKKIRNRYQNLKIAPIKVAFERGIWGHYRMIFEKQ